MGIVFRPAAGASDCHFIHDLIMSEVPNGHFDAQLLSPGASAGLMLNIQKMVVEQRRFEPQKREVPAHITMVDIYGETAGFGITTVLQIEEVRFNELWLAGVAARHRRRGAMTSLVGFYCAQLDLQGIRMAARLLPASQGMRVVLASHGFEVLETLSSGHAFLVRNAKADQRT
ncbi:hypothetical protein [Xanthomonas arboricola]|uniref:GNAT family N-acetyltransferase n=1 Tax=Xanthomonas arboricola TaxID=56448 RepID=A0A2S7AE75_9XANT|nr:hypothetical protein [Xanthomonas arboricola]PPU07891.1 hypothetical protein XarjCFBP7645_09900 [Xanthomonas arboricola]